ncbi:hypothetical protein ACFLV7_14710 [Chloroflexota bacterium]
MPVLARTLETAGFSTILVTMMPFWAERVGVPRALTVEFPFAQTLGQPHNRSQQMSVIQNALKVLEETDQPGIVFHSPEEWPIPKAQAIKAWQPAEPAPIIREMAPQIRTLLRQRRNKSRPVLRD